MKLPSLALAILSMAALPQLRATVLVNTDFDAGYTAGQSLNGQSGSGDVNFLGAFSSLDNVQVVNASGANDLTYQVAGGGTISSGSHVAQFTSTSGDAVLTVARNLSTVVTGQTVFARIVMSAVVPSANSLTSLNFFLNAPGNAFELEHGTGFGQFGTSAGAGIGFGANNTATFGNLTDTSVNLLVASFNWDGTKYSSVSFWLNPMSDSLGAPNATASTLSGVTSLSQIGLTVANLSATSGTATYNFDSFLVGTAWDDVVAVPEPSTTALVATAGFFITVRLRRKANA